MNQSVTRSTIYLDSELHRALRLKAAHMHRSISELVNDAVRNALQEDREDLSAIGERIREPLLDYEELLKSLKKHGKI